MKIFTCLFFLRLHLKAGAVAVLLLSLDLIHCSQKQKTTDFVPSKEFMTYWNDGKAEIAKYDLVQARYGNLQKGSMIVIFVTEPFYPDKQVKAEIEPIQGSENVFKAHILKRFVTGIYDYSIVQSSFSPMYRNGNSKAYKVTLSAQDWCGQSFMQLNLKENSYIAQVRSYFEKEGDRDYNAGVGISEDEIWQLIRLDPKLLPIGEIDIIPSAFSTRLRHKDWVTKKAEAKIDRLVDSSSSGARGDGLRYVLTYDKGSEEERVVIFEFDDKFPHTIRTVTETYLDGFQNPKKLTSVATLKGSILSDYWAKHNPEHRILRSELDLPIDQL